MRPAKPVATDPNQAHEETLRLRDRILGVNLRLAREAAGRSIQDCAGRLKISPEAMAAWEIGDGHPSPPQLDMLAAYLNVSVGDLWQAPEPRQNEGSETRQGESQVLRQRIAGGLLRAARQSKNMELDELSTAAAIDVELLSAYELGERVIPFDQLTILAGALERDLTYFEATGTDLAPIAQYLAALPSDLEIPDALQQLASDQRAEGVVKLAAAFSRIPSDELRRIADALLVISEAKSLQNGA